MKATAAETIEEASRQVMAALATNRADIPMAALYLGDERGGPATLVAAAGIDVSDARVPRSTSLDPIGADGVRQGERPWPFAQARDRQEPVELRLPYDLPAGDGQDALTHAVILPLRQTHGFLVIATSPGLRYDDDYASFLRLAGAHVAAAFVNAQQQKEERLQEFLAMLAHELRNPLAPIRTAAALLQTRVGADARAHQYLDTIERQSENLSRLIDDLLDVSRITRGLIELKREPVDMMTIVERSLESLRGALDKKRINVVVAGPRHAATVVGDPVRLEQIVVNLVGNAAKYSEAGTRIDIAVNAGPVDVDVRVKDTGIGISKDMLPRVFDLFQQADRTLDRARGGLGIGLTIVKNLVALHGGTVEAASRGAGRGSEFIVRLPAVDAAVDASIEGAAVPVASAAGARRRVLVVDDNIDAADTLADLATEWGHDVKSAHDGPGALRAAEELVPDIVLLDIGLPQMDGYEVARRMRKNPRLDGTFLVALTGYGQPRDRERALEAGFDRHLVKPVDIDALELMLKTARRSPSIEPTAPTP